MFPEFPLMPLADFVCTTCGRIESDVLIGFGHAVDVDCIHSDGSLNPMRRTLGRPAPAIFTSGGTGASRGAA